MIRVIVLLIFFLLLNVNCFEAKVLDKRFQIIPLPQNIEVKNGNGISFSDISFVLTEDTIEYPVLGELLDRLPRLRKSGIGVKLLIDLVETPESGDGYVLDINKDEIKVMSRGRSGLFYGCQTLEQLMEDSRDFNINIPFMRIVDYPKIAYRAVHFDTKHHLDRVEYYYRMIDRLARYKINAVIWEIEDKLMYSRHPEISSPNAISKQEMQSICRYAMERNIEISPLVQGLGHAGFILKHHWELRENQYSDWEFCPSNSKTYDLQFDLYLDAIEAMPYGKYLHIGGDEITAIGIDDRCKSTGKTPFELQMMWLKKVCDFANSRGRIPIFWDDMPLKFADLWWLLHRNLTDSEIINNWNTSKLDEAMKLFPKNCVYMRWHYEDPTILPHRLLLDWYAKNGLNVMGATAAVTGETPFISRPKSRIQYIKDFSILADKNKLCGILSTAWDDASVHWETIMRGFISQGEYGWNPEGRTLSEYMCAYSQREFGVESSKMEFINEIENSAYFFDHALIESGNRNPAWGVSKDFKLIDLPDVSNPGNWCLKYKSKLDSLHVELKRYKKICNSIKLVEKEVLRNRYTIEIYKQTNELLNIPAKIMLALEDFDKTVNKHDRDVAKRNILTICDDFYKIKAGIENAYSKTRFMNTPEGYIADHNHHSHLASLSYNSDWMFLYEIPMVKEIMEWVKSID